MRIIRNLQRKSGNKEPKNKYYIVPEGDKTEIKYFCGIRDNAQYLKIKQLIDIVLLENDNDESHPKKKLENFKKTLDAGNIVFDKEIDKVCFIFDRDPQNFKEKQFEDIKKQCEYNGYILCITNPTFELFLLMHSDKVFKLDKEKMLLNEKQGNKRFLEIEVSKEFGHGKINLDFDKFKSKVWTAIKNEKNFCEDLDGLKTQLGSNIGLVLENIINK